MIQRFIDFLLIFSYLFCFSLKGGHGIDSSMVVALFLIIYGIFHNKYVRVCSDLLLSKYSRKIYGYYFLINVWILITVTFQGAYDFSYMLTFLHMLFLIIVGILLFAYFSYKGVVYKIVWFMIAAFALQSIIEWGAFLIPSFKAIINTTKSEETILKGISYGGVRANSLAGSDFFGLSAAFSVIFLIYLSKMNTWFRNNRPLKFILFVLLLSGTFFAGRTGYIGLIVVALFVIFNKKMVLSYRKYTSKEKLSVYICLGLLFSLVNYLIFLFYTNEDIHNLLFFTFQNFFSYAEKGTMQTSTMDSLENMYFGIDVLTFLLGDGFYTTKDGGYYMMTDVGYMRVILYMGIVGLILLLFMQKAILCFRYGREIKLKKYLLVLLLVLNAKGEVLVWNQIVLDTVLLFSLQDCFGNNYYSRKGK